MAQDGNATGGGETNENEEAVGRARSVKERHALQLKSYPNVVGVGVAHEVVGGQRTDRICIRVYVRRKLPKSALPPEAVLPDSIDGLPVDVIEDEFSIHQAPPVTLEDHRRPHTFLLGGISIGNLLLGGSGTLGVSVFDNRTGQEMLLSNWHVLCGSDHCQVGEPIIQPGTGGGDIGTASDVVARLSRSVLGAEVDAAIAQPSGQRFLFKEVLEIGPVDDSGLATLEMSVRKSGRTSGLTAATVADISADVDVQGYPDGTRSFHNQIVIEGTGEISVPGDSGSVWVDDQNKVVGLNFAGSTKRAIANHIDSVLEALDINLGPGMTILEWHTEAATL
jgi:hypothetical protein